MTRLGMLMFAAVSSMMLSVHYVSAQTAPPSDLELLAGYCTGVTQAKQSFMAQTLQNVPAESTQAATRQILQDLERDRQRFLGYLLSDAQMDWTGVVIAANSGKSDFQEVMNEVDKTCGLRLPKWEDARKHGLKWVEAEESKAEWNSQECVNNLPAKSRMDRCKTANLLPF